MENHLNNYKSPLPKSLSFQRKISDLNSNDYNIKRVKLIYTTNSIMGRPEQTGMVYTECKK